MKIIFKSLVLPVLLAAGALLGVSPAPALAQVVIYYHTDALGSPVATTDASGAVVERTEYEPYGKVLNHALANGPGYTGHVSDAETGLSYMQQRYYDPQIGRFLSVDPVGVSPINGLNFNRYWYASNNPYKNTDPDGRCDGPSTCAIDRDIAAMNRGDMSRREFMDRSAARGVGAAIGLSLVASGSASLFLLRNPKELFLTLSLAAGEGDVVVALEATAARREAAALAAEVASKVSKLSTVPVIIEVKPPPLPPEPNKPSPPPETRPDEPPPPPPPPEIQE